MINKTIRQNIEIAVGTREIMKHNPRITKESEVFSYAYHQVASDIKANSDFVIWDEIALIDFKDRRAEIEFPETRAVSADEADFDVVLKHFSDRPNVHRVQFAYLTRLVLLYTRRKLRDMKGVAEYDAEAKPEMNREIIKSESGDTMMKVGALYLSKKDKDINRLRRILEVLEEE